MPVFTDQTGRKIKLNKTPRRIISLVPSQTELLFDLRLKEEVIGITKFCVHPQEWFCSKTKIGGTKQLKIDQIIELNPDLIIANKEENVKEQIEELEKHFPVWISDVNNLDDACEMIEQIGSLTGKVNKSKEIVSSIKEKFTRLRNGHSPLGARGACYLIWQNPNMTAGGDTFINSMIEAAGFENAFKNKTRYPEITIKDLLNAQCRFLFLSSEPFPFRQKHAEEFKAILSKVKGDIKAHVLLVDGEMFSWYGSRLLKAPEYFIQLQKQIKSLLH